MTGERKTLKKERISENKIRGNKGRQEKGQMSTILYLGNYPSKSFLKSKQKLRFLSTEDLPYKNTLNGIFRVEMKTLENTSNSYEDIRITLSANVVTAFAVTVVNSRDIGH